MTLTVLPFLEDPLSVKNNANVYVTFDKRDLEFSKIFKTPVFNISENSDLILVFQCRYVNCFGIGRVLVIIFFHISVSFVCISSLVVLAKRKGGTVRTRAGHISIAR